MVDLPDDDRRILAESRPFKGLPEDLISSLLARMDERSFKKGDKIICQDQRGDQLYALMDGTASVVVFSNPTNPNTVANVGSGDVIGEMALLSGEPTSADVVANGPVRALSLEAESFHELARQHPEIAVVLTTLIADRLGRSAGDALGGKVVNGYRILRCVGQGGMAVVYEAERQTDSKRFALKMMSHRLSYDTTARSRFREEASLVQELNHPNLAQLVESFRAYGTNFLVMEFCDGPGLDMIAAKQVPFPEPLVRPVIGQFSRVLDYVHSNGVLHRDIKPSNAMLTMAGELKLVDFGIARPIEQTDDRTQTHESSIVGTPNYMAPELFEETNEVDERVDTYALACVAFELLAGRRPFKPSNTYRMMQQKMTFEVEPKEKIGLGISEEMHAFLVRNLAPEPDGRDRSLAAQGEWVAPIQIDALMNAD
jgi:CRP-like cAMP-binding protein